ncbi:RHS repeat-associated core domain-containing protein [Streptomyces globisporus]|uniref:RHS repeat-associated core domain-containing protein n=1 Tax=Streptomyces globisporus TaxID=1908 RepID=UPI0037B95ACF
MSKNSSPPPRPRARQTALLVFLAAALSIPTSLTPLASAAERPGRPNVSDVKSTTVKNTTTPSAAKARAKVASAKKDDRRSFDHAEAERARATWPKQTSAATDLDAAGAKPIGPVTVDAVTPDKSSRQARPRAGGTAKITVLDQKVADKAGITGVLFTATAEQPGTAKVTVDYSGFASAIGGDWAGRLGLVQMPACILTTPDKHKCRTTTSVKSVNNPKTQTVTARTAITNADSARNVPNKARSISAPTVFALTAAAATSASGLGDFKATALSASSSWEAGSSSGAFSWTYPLTVPPAAAGPVPSLALSYDSGSIDGRTANTNNQSSQVGEGFDLTSSYIERKYGSCEDDGQSDKFDQCWKYENASLVLNGKASELVKDDGTGAWRLKNDDASQVTHETGATNGDDGDDIVGGKGDGKGEYWKVVTGDGTVYTFGLNKLAGAGTERTNSVWTVPVFGDDSGEPGYSSGTGFSGRAKTQAWRWNLDLVTDIHGNAATYWYKAETNHYAKNGDKTKLAEYTRGGYINEIRYGQRADTLFTGQPSGKVTYTYKERCTASDCSSLTKDTADNWPDVPFDTICSASETDCKGTGPAFFTRKRLIDIDTYSWSRAAEPDAYVPVDSYTLTQMFWDGQDIDNSSDQSLVLTKLVRTGKTATPVVSAPPVEFTYQQRPNRVDATFDDILPLTRPRIEHITSETGAITTVALSPTECVRGSNMPAAEDGNNKSCYPVYWPINGGDPALDWFHKYRVLAITTNDPATGNPGTESQYSYATPGWHYNDDPFTKEKERTWSSWRGYQKVTTTSGEVGGTQSKTVSLYMQGMHGDKKKDGTTRTATVQGIDLPSADMPDATDTDYWAGQLRQQITYNGSTPISFTFNNLWAKQTASQQKSYAHVKAHYIRNARTYTRTWLTASNSWRVTAVSNTFDDTYGMVTKTEDHGNWSATGDETCTRTWYARNTAVGLTSPVSRTRTVAKACADTDDKLALPALAEGKDKRGDVLSDTAVVYDTAGSTVTGWAPGQKPTVGLPTWTGRAQAYPATNGTADRNPAVSGGWQTVATTEYDTATAKLGRPLKVTDVKGRTTTTAYYPAAAGPLATVVVTKPKLASNNQAHQSSTYLDPSRGSVNYSLDANLKRTENTYDAFGRIIATWMPNRSKSGGDSPSAKYDYGLERNKAPWTSVATLKADNTSYRTVYALLDSMLRPVQTQSPSPNGGRILTDTRYDSRGLADETYTDVYDSDHAPSSTYAKVPYGSGSQTLTDYDGAGRITKSTFMVNGVKKWDTTTTYTGDSTATTAPAGGNASRTITDVLGRVKETRTYAGTQPDDTQYGATLGTPYTRAAHTQTRDGKPEMITGIDDTKWFYTYDLFGRQRIATDPDKGKSTTSYTELDQIDSITDSENKVLLYEYDELGRKTKQWQTSRTDANLQAEWTFDSITGAKGLPVASTRYEEGKGQSGSKAYTKQVTAYDALSRATAGTVALPPTDALVTSGAVTATSTTEVAYRLDGTVKSLKSAAGGGLAAETVTADYNADSGLITGLSGASGYLLGASYTSLGQVAQLQLGTATAAGTKRVFQTNTYEAGTGRLLTAATDDQTRGPVQDLNYTYDQAGNVTAITDQADIGTGTDNQCFTYDGNNRLTEAWTPKTANCAIAGRTTANLGGPAPYWTSYTYNKAGQRQTEKQNTGTPVTRTYCYNDPDHPHGLTATTTSSNCTGVAAQYTYDKTGNTTTRVEKAGSSATQSLQWNAEGRPVKLTEGTTATDYVYDADGELLIRRDNATSGETVLYLGDTEVHLKSGKKWANRYYTAAGSTIAIRSNETGTEKLSFLAADHHSTSSVAINADTTQTLTKRYTTPFGSARGNAIGTWPDDKSFLGKTTDKTTGLTHIGAREYDTTIGQFLSVDPLLETTKHQTLNGYSYAANSPVTYSDPTGTCLDPGNGHCQPGSGGGNNHDPSFPKNTSSSTSGAGTGNNSSGSGNNSSGTGSGGGQYHKTKANSSQDQADRNTYTDAQRAADMRKQRLQNIFAGMYEFGEYLDEIDDINDRFCRGSARDGCKISEISYEMLMENAVEGYLANIDESWTSESEEFGFGKPKEFNIAFKLAMEGHKVVARGSGTGKHGDNPKSFDAWVDGVRSEFKETGKRNMKNHMRKADEQGADVVYLRTPGVSEEAARKEVWTVIVRTKSNLTSVRVIGDEYDFTMDNPALK